MQSLRILFTTAHETQADHFSAHIALDATKFDEEPYDVISKINREIPPDRRRIPSR